MQTKQNDVEAATKMVPRWATKAINIEMLYSVVFWISSIDSWPSRHSWNAEPLPFVSTFIIIIYRKMCWGDVRRESGRGDGELFSFLYSTSKSHLLTHAKAFCNCPIQACGESTERQPNACSQTTVYRPSDRSIVVLSIRMYDNNYSM